MKLVYCTACLDIVKLNRSLRKCICGKSGGYYLADGINVEIFGQEAVPLGIGNTTFRNALNNRPKHGSGERFEAFVIPKNCGTVKRLDI